MFDLRLLFVAAVWGMNFSVIKYAIGSFHPLAFTVVRFAIASVFLLSVMAARRESFTIQARDRPSIALLGLSGISLYNLFFMYGLAYTTAANSAMLIALSPVFGALYQAATGKERITLRVAGGLAVATLGVLLIVSGHSGELHFTCSGAFGDLLTLCASATWAVYTIKARPLLERYSATAVTAYAMAAGSALLLPLGLPGLFQQQWNGLPGLAWSSLAFSALIAAGVAYVFWYQGVKRIGVTRTMVYHYLMPFSAVLFAAGMLGEPIHALQLFGGAAVLAGVFLVQSRPAAR